MKTPEKQFEEELNKFDWDFEHKLSDTTIIFGEKRKNRVLELAEHFIEEARKEEREKIKAKIGLLRQYLNERNKKGLITNEELEEFLS